MATKYAFREIPDSEDELMTSSLDAISDAVDKLSRASRDGSQETQESHQDVARVHQASTDNVSNTASNLEKSLVSAQENSSTDVDVSENVISANHQSNDNPAQQDADGGENSKRKRYTKGLNLNDEVSDIRDTLDNTAFMERHGSRQAESYVRARVGSEGSTKQQKSYQEFGRTVSTGQQSSFRPDSDLEVRVERERSTEKLGVEAEYSKAEDGPKTEHTKSFERQDSSQGEPYGSMDVGSQEPAVGLDCEHKTLAIEHSSSQEETNGAVDVERERFERQAPQGQDAIIVADICQDDIQPDVGRKNKIGEALEAQKSIHNMGTTSEDPASIKEQKALQDTSIEDKIVKCIDTAEKQAGSQEAPHVEMTIEKATPVKEPEYQPRKSRSPTKSPQETTVAELRAQRAALLTSLVALPNVRELIPDDKTSFVTCQDSTAAPSDTEIMAAANKIVKKHIKLLHEYNEIKDVGQGLMGLIADQRGVRIVEVQDEFGVGSKD